MVIHNYPHPALSAALARKSVHKWTAYWSTDWARFNVSPNTL